MTSIHQLTQFVLALCVLYSGKLNVQHLSPSERLRVMPATLASACDIGLSNTSLLLVTLSFYTMIKSSSLGFVLLFSVLFRLEKLTSKLVMIVAVLSIGVFMMVLGETEFSLPGLLLVLGAAASSGLRWSLIKIFLNGGDYKQDIEPEQRHKKPHPVQLILALSPGMFIVLLIWGLIVETPSKFVESRIWDGHILLGLFLLLFPAVLVFGMTWTEFELLNCTSPLTLVIAGIMKEIITIIVSTLMFHDKLSRINVIGLIVSLCAVGAYHYYRIRD